MIHQTWEKFHTIDTNFFHSTNTNICFVSRHHFGFEKLFGLGDDKFFYNFLISDDAGVS